MALGIVGEIKIPRVSSSPPGGVALAIAGETQIPSVGLMGDADDTSSS